MAEQLRVVSPPTSPATRGPGGTDIDTTGVETVIHRKIAPFDIKLRGVRSSLSLTYAVDAIPTISLATGAGEAPLSVGTQCIGVTTISIGSAFINIYIIE